MNEQHMQVFVDATKHYFSHLSNKPATVQVPYLINHDDAVLFDYTGIIGIGGKYRGNVYFTAPETMMQYVLMTQGEQVCSAEFCLDIVGEVANTVAGNARRDLGPEFVISAPIKFAGKPDKMLLGTESRSYAIPIQWRLYTAAIVVSVT